MTASKKKPAIIKKPIVKTVKNVVSPWTWRFSFITAGIYVIAVTSVIVLAMFTASTITSQEQQGRLTRINNVYTAIGVDDSYLLQDSDVFGDKRVYEWDSGRTYSSSKKYVHPDTVSNTVAELDAKIKAAGFAFIDEPYKGSVYTQYHYKSPKGEYVRLTVSSKPYDDATFNAYQMDKDAPFDYESFDKNAGPANVTIKVNLDDNNE